MGTKTVDKLIPLFIAFFICIVVIAMIPSASLTTATTPLYAHSEALSIGATSYKALKTTACDGPEASIAIDSIGTSGFVALGNSSAIALSDLDSQITSIKTATWTIRYYALANVTLKTTLLCNITLVHSNGTQKSTLAGYSAETALLTASNATVTGTVSISETSVATSDYLRVIWYANKTDTTNLRITLWLDVTATPTYISGVGYEYDALKGTARLMAYTATTFIMLSTALTAIYIGLKSKKG